MKKFSPVILAMILTLSAFRVPSVLAAPEPPVTPGRVLIALLSGPAIDGVTPTAKAEFATVQGQTALEVRASKLNLPDGTCLNVAFGRTVLEGIAVRSGQAFVSLSPSPEEIHPGEDITISTSPVADDLCGIIVLPLTTLAPAPGSYRSR